MNHQVQVVVHVPRDDSPRLLAVPALLRVARALEVLRERVPREVAFRDLTLLRAVLEEVERERRVLARLVRGM